MSLGRTMLIRSFQAGRDTELPFYSSAKMYSSRIPNSCRVLIWVSKRLSVAACLADPCVDVGYGDQRLILAKGPLCRGGRIRLPSFFANCLLPAN